MSGNKKRGGVDHMTKKIIEKKELNEIEAKVPKRKLLLNKASLEISIFAAKGRLEYRNCLHVTKDYVEATSGPILVRLSHPKFDPDEFPATPGEGFDEIDFLLPIEGVKKVKLPAKMVLPILLNACLSKEGEMIDVSTTDLAETTQVKIRPIEKEFPDTEQIIDKSIDVEENNKWKMFTLNSDILKTLVNYVSKRNGRDDIPITFWVKDPEGPVHFRFRFSDTEQDGRGVLGPMRGVDVRKGFSLV